MSNKFEQWTVDHVAEIVGSVLITVILIMVGVLIYVVSTRGWF